MKEYSQRPVKEQRELFHDEDFDKEHKGYMRDIIDLMYARHDEFKLLICCAEGTRYADFVEDIAELDEKYTVIILSLGLLEPLIAAMNYTDNIARVGTVMGQINDVLASPEISRTDKERDISGNMIEFRNVTFSYDDEKEALKKISLTIPEGKVTALVGASGSGKSTVAKLIACFWDVTEGELLIGGVNVRNIPLEAQAERIAYVEQNNFLFDDTFMENIRMGRAGATDEDVIAAAKAAGCDEFIRGLDKGYHTVVGSAGGHLSGGERQRIAIARAMLKDAPIVILDEATAYIDPENEAMIQKAIVKLMKGKTVIVVLNLFAVVIMIVTAVLYKNGSMELANAVMMFVASFMVFEQMKSAGISIATL